MSKKYVGNIFFTLKAMGNKINLVPSLGGVMLVIGAVEYLFKGSAMYGAIQEFGLSETLKSLRQEYHPKKEWCCEEYYLKLIKEFEKVKYATYPRDTNVTETIVNPSTKPSAKQSETVVKPSETVAR